MYCAKFLGDHRSSGGPGSSRKEHRAPVRDWENPAFNQVWVQGRAMTLEQAIEYALALGTS